jgi:hypothetical protein
MCVDTLHKGDNDDDDDDDDDDNNNNNNNNKRTKGAEEPVMTKERVKLQTVLQFTLFTHYV